MGSKLRTYVLLAVTAIVIIFAAIACGGGGMVNNPNNGGTPPPPPSSSPPPSGSTGSDAQAPICNCTPTESDSNDYRHDAKRIPLPGGTPIETSVAEILTWDQPADPSFTAPRSGRELQLYHIAHAYLQAIWLEPGDCDMHVEISDVPDKHAPRMIVETPRDSEYCPARRTLESQVAAHGITNLYNHIQQDLMPQGVLTEVTGLAFQDARHPRGSPYVATVWELHPAIVNMLQ